ncbi:hypothetical protein [Alkalicoccus chagannorensis]|uniref:hypothetical protein n=1 Tax=Alkalicoccus chagannorensis TaxID=427072 RepID=UPI0003F97053|nr:hypothetical protein [Alkalicoccus chagannorensis]
MDEEKRIIVKEIRKWQESGLLPETYCRFLLSLYLEGDEDPLPEAQEKSGGRNKAWIGLGLFLSIVLILLFTMLFALLPVDSHLYFLGAASVAGAAVAAFYYRRASSFVHVYVILTAFLTFFTTVTAAEQWFPDSRTALGTSIALLSTSWAAVGWTWRFQYLLLAGIGGWLMLGIFLLIEQV